MNTRRLVFSVLLALAAAVGAQATIGLGLQAPLGNPSGATADPANHTNYLIERAQYSLDYNDTTREANWVSWSLTSSDVGGSGRSPDFFVDTSLPPGFYQVLTTDYSGSGYDRGHMTPSADRTVTRADNDVTFLMSNMVPQTPDNNQGIWASFETYCRTLASAGNEVLITSGTSGFGGSTIASGVAIPGYTWKVAVVVPLGPGTAVDRIVAAGAAAIRVIAIKVPNIAGIRSTPWENFVTSAAQIQSDTGHTFFTALPAPIAADFRNRIDGQTSAGAPAIVVQPVPQSAPVDGNATFTVTASGNAPLTYQWYHDDIEIAGATGDTLSLTGVQADDVGTYYVVVTNDVGATSSASVALIVTGLPPTVTTQPVSRSVNAGTNVSFTVTAGGSAPFTYQWHKNGAAYPGDAGNATGTGTPTLTLTNVQAGDVGSYYVVITNNVSSVTSHVVSLSVQAAAPSIISQPANRSLAPGSTATFSVVAAGSETLVYQWFKGASPIPAGSNPTAATPTLVLTGISLADAGSYNVVVSNGIGAPAVSDPASLSISSASATQIFYTGGTYVQDFDTLPTTGGTLPTLSGVGPFYAANPVASGGVNAANLGGWSFAKIGGSGVNASFQIGTGSNNAGAVYSFGAVSTTDRAFGALFSGSIASTWGATFVNHTGQTITQFTLSYTGEQWRYGAGTLGGTDRISAEYSLGAANILSGSYTQVPALDFASPVNSATAVGTSGAINGNAAANRALRTATITGVAWAAGQTLVIRWRDFDVGGSDDGLAIDNFSLSTAITGPVGPSVVATEPTNSATDVALNAAIAVTFDQAVNAAGSAFTVNSASRGVIAGTVSASADKKVYTFIPPTNFDFSDVVSVNISAAGVTSVSTGLHPAGDHAFQFVTSAPVPSSITSQPANQLNVPAGGNASFSVGATGTAPFTYQWRKGGVPISGNATAATATLVLTNVQAGDVGSYDVVVGNSVGAPVTSNAAALTVTPAAPQITTQPVAQTLPVGGTITLTVAAKGTMPFTYQWRRGTTVVGSSQTLVIANAQVTDSGSYTVVVSNGVGSPVTSTAASVLVVAPPSVLNYSGGTYAQDFNTLPSTGTFTFTGVGPFSLDANPGVNAAGLAGWSFGKAAGSGANALFRFDNGSSNSGGTVSYGTTGAPDRALGSLASGTMASRVGVTLVNTSGQTIQFVTISYTGEQWRHGGAITPNKFAFSYAVGATDISTGTFAPAPALDFIAPIVTTTTSALDGNLAANRVAGITATLTGLNWAPGQTLVLRWNDVDDSGSDDALAIDDFTLTDAPPVPEIVGQPANQAVTAFTPASFSVAATSLTPLSYQWLKDGAPITDNPSALTATLLLASPVVADAGAYRCIVTNSFGSTPSLAATLTVEKAAATVSLETMDFTYTGEPQGATATTNPAGLNVLITYDGNASAPVNAGAYAVIATVNDANYTGTTTGTLTIAQDEAVVVIGALSQVYDGAPKSVLVATSPAGLTVNTTYAGSPVPPTNAGSYAVVSTVIDPNYTGMATDTLTITPAQATITLGNLVQAYDGTPKAATVTTSPSGLAVTVTYDGSATPPTLPGSYAVVATSTDANQAGSATGTLLITVTALVRHAPTMNGDIDGSVQVLLPESTTLNGSAMISGDLLIPGTPSIRLNGNPIYVSTKDGSGAANPSSHVITLNGNSVLRHVVRRVDAIAMPVVAAPAAPAGSRDVSLNNPTQTPGDFATLRNFTLNGSGQSVAVPAGTYGAFTLNGNNVIRLGVEGGTTPIVYNLQSLTLNGSSQIQVLGPVVLNLASGTSLNGTVGSPAHPEWLTLNIASGGLTLNSNSSLHGVVNAPAGLITIGGNSVLRGRVVADRLTLNGNAQLTGQ